MVRVYDDYLDIRDSATGHIKGNLRVIIYLEDCGPVPSKPKETGNSLQKAREMKMAGVQSNPGSMQNFEVGNG
jgi:hypothetical protein